MNAFDMFPEAVVPDVDENKRYTTTSFMAWIKRTAGVSEWDLDVAADAESHHAPLWFARTHEPGCAGVDGLWQSWLPPGHTTNFNAAVEWAVARPWAVFCNPPFDDLGAWVQQAWDELARSTALMVPVRLAMVLPGNRHEQPWWQEHVEPFRFEISRRARYGYELTLHHPPGRQAYARPGSGGKPVGSAEWPSCILVWRRA